MPKFSGTQPAVATSSPITTQTPTITHEGAAAYSPDAKSELFLLAVTNMVSEDTFYESASDRDARFRSLITQLTAEDPEWLQAFIAWLRRAANMRSAPVVALAEYVRAGGPSARALIAKTLSRADEPAELIGYWLSRYARPIPKPIKRGISDYLNTLTEYSALKYDGQSRDIRLGDVIELTHPNPKDNRQSHLYKWLLDRRHQGTAKADGRVLKVIHKRQLLESTPTEHRRLMLGELINDSGLTWEWLSGWLPGGMDKDAWEAVIPQMGYMALLRNLRNFDEAGVKSSVKTGIKLELTHPDNVARSRQFPYRFWSAYKATRTLHWASALEEALELSTQNIPAFPGRTLILTDTSASMRNPVSHRSEIRHFEIAALFAAALGSKSEDVALVSFASDASRIPFKPGDSVLRTMEKVDNHIGKDGHGTDIVPGLRYFDNHDRIVVFSDMQITGRFGLSSRAPVLPEVPVYLFNTSGYGRSPYETGTGLVHEIGGFTDAAFRMIPLLEAGRNARWPWEMDIDWSTTA